MKTFDLPGDLHATRDLLGRSLKLDPMVSAPPVPQGLVADLNQRFTKTIPMEAAQRGSWLSRAASFIASPGFGLAAVAAVVLAVAGPALVDQGTPAAKETFRGGSAVEAASPRILMVGASSETLSLLKTSGLFDPQSILVSDQSDSEVSPRVVVDFNAGVVTAYNAAGEPIHSTEIPEDPAALASAITASLGHL